MNIRYSKIAETIICKSVIETDNVCNKINFLFCFVSDALLIAGMRILLVGMVVIKILNAKVVAKLLMLTLSKTIMADTNRTMEKFYV